MGDEGDGEKGTNISETEEMRPAIFYSHSEDTSDSMALTSKDHMLQLEVTVGNFNLPILVKSLTSRQPFPSPSLYLISSFLFSSINLSHKCHVQKHKLGVVFAWSARISRKV